METEGLVSKAPPQEAIRFSEVVPINPAAGTVRLLMTFERMDDMHLY